jgi:putative transposase
MGWFILVHIFTTWLSILSIGRLSEEEKDLEILLLRHQLAILQRKCDQPVKPNRIEKMTLAVITARLKQISYKTTSQLRDILRIFQPETVMGWHRQLVRRKWTYLHHSHGGRPRINKELERLILHLAKENPRWGDGKIEGELLKLDY